MVSFYLAATPGLKVRTGNPARPPLFSGEAHCLVSNICIFLDGAVGSWRHCSALVAWRRPSLGKARWSVTQESKRGGRRICSPSAVATAGCKASAATLSSSLLSSLLTVPTVHGQHSGLGSSWRPVLLPAFSLTRGTH